MHSNQIKYVKQINVELKTLNFWEQSILKKCFVKYHCQEIWPHEIIFYIDKIHVLLYDNKNKVSW